MRAFLLLSALALTGCATSRAPTTPFPPTTLQEVNAILESRLALVTLEDGTEVRAYARVGPMHTVLSRRAVAEAGSGEGLVPTSAIVHIAVDDSPTESQGAIGGTIVGMVPGGIMVLSGFSVYATSNCREFCVDGVALISMGAFLAQLGAGLGREAGAAIGRQKHFVVVYKAPVTRYPDAALVLLQAPEASGDSLSTSR